MPGSGVPGCDTAPQPPTGQVTGACTLDRMTPQQQHGTELGRFLRARRARVTPGQAGLPPGARLRRTPGLRREELAILAGISVDYCIRLERGKETRPSPSVVDALARALLLEPDETQHLRTPAVIAARTAPQPPIAPSRTVRPGVKLLLESLRPAPERRAAFLADVGARRRWYSMRARTGGTRECGRPAGSTGCSRHESVMAGGETP